ncbi:MAG TPA: hypothetical protein PKA53_07015, partial [Sphingobacterium sp.]|nr:hypothetical protein [Sphingobacterium sp.]
MNKKYFSSTIRSITFTIFFLVVSMPLFSQEITEKNYLKLDSALWIQYEQDMEKISKDFTNYPEKKDSLQKVSEYIFEVTSKKNRELAIQYASVPSGLQRIFMTRLRIPKNTLDSVLKSLPDEIKNSQYAKNIQYHIESKQLEEGDKYQDMVLKTDEGKDFKLSSLQGKDILFIYGGLDCMGVAGRKYLNTLYS